MGPTRAKTRAGTIAAAAALAALLCLAAFPGASGAEPSTRIVGGSVVPAAAVPWQVAVYEERVGGGVLFCGGSLIRPRIVLTAAHCVLSPSPIATSPGNDYVAAGAGQFSDAKQGRSIHIASTVANPSFSETTKSGDAAILVLDQPVPPELGTPIKLAGPDEHRLWSTGKIATVSGFGAQAEGTPGSSDFLKATQVPVLSDAYCRQSYGALFAQITELCAGFAAGGADACQGDSGGPLTVPARGGDGGFVRQIGIVSFGNGCARPNAPGVYSRVGTDPLQAFIQAAVNQSPDPGDVIGNGGVCAGLPGKTLQKCRCKNKSSRKKRKKCLQKLKVRKHKGRDWGKG